MAKIPVARLEIRLEEDGSVFVSGEMNRMGVKVGEIVDNKIFAYGLLLSARDAIDENIKAKARLVQPAAFLSNS